MSVTILVKKIYDDSIIPKYQTEYASCVDLHAYNKESITIQPNQIKLIKTGIAVGMPKKYAQFNQQYEMQIRSRSGLSLKQGLIVLNAPGTIDLDYIGQIGVIMYNASNQTRIINHGDRIAQMALAKVSSIEFVQADILQQTGRDPNGFGTTGKNNEI